MTGRVQEHPPPLAAGLVVRLHRAEPQHPLLGRVEIPNAEVQVELLGHVLTGPLRGPVPVDPLKAQVAAGAAGQCDELTADIPPKFRVSAAFDELAQAV